jgi:hypothetical protein
MIVQGIFSIHQSSQTCPDALFACVDGEDLVTFKEVWEIFGILNQLTRLRSQHLPDYAVFLDVLQRIEPETIVDSNGCETL